MVTHHALINSTNPNKTNMNKNHLAMISICLATLFGAAFLSSLTGIAAEPKTATDAAAPTKVYTAEETKEFVALTRATLEAIATGKQMEMVAKLTDLETAWDDKEKILRSKDEATWTLLDKTLDKGISALRSSHIDLQKGKSALEDLLKKLDQATKEKAEGKKD
jgi:hypothetical protein